MVNLNKGQNIRHFYQCSENNFRISFNITPLLNSIKLITQDLVNPPDLN